MLEGEIDVESKDTNGLTALQLCAVIGNTASAEVLLVFSYQI